MDSYERGLGCGPREMSHAGPVLLLSSRVCVSPLPQILVDDLKVWCGNALGPTLGVDGQRRISLRVGHPDFCA